METKFIPAIVALVGIASANDQQTMLESFTVAPGLEAKLWAGSDLIHSPVAIAVDAKGRVWATEDLQHSGDKDYDEKLTHSRIKILEDTDHDGRADSVKIFGPTFPSKPLGISVFDNVVVVSMAPKIHVFTDVDRDDVFDPAVDTEVILAEGFHGGGHDHGLHQVVPGPSGKWYFNHGNIGADVTMADGRKIHASSYYSQNPESIGKKSFDGRLYVGGFGVRMNPDGSEAEVIFHNTRNAHAMLVTSFGDVLHSDNDDPAHSRAAWAMEHANFGYASLEDGNRSWEDSAKSWEEKLVGEDVKANAYERHAKSVLRRDEGHWREHFPGVTPPGNVWGPGGPTGDYMIEGDELGEAFRGSYLVCDTVHRAVFRFRPELRDAQVELLDLEKDFFATDRAAENEMAAEFLPTDVAGATDGSLFVSDWSSGIIARKSGNGDGAIFRIARKGRPVRPPVIDFDTTKGLLEAMKSPAPGVRWVAQDRLKKRDDVYDAVEAFFNDNEANPYYQARAVFVLAQIDDPRGTEFVNGMLSSENPQWRITAFRALRLAGKERLLPLIEQLVDDPSPAVRREILAPMRNMEFESIRQPIKTLIAGYDGKNRWYLEALGAVFDEHRDMIYEQIVKPQQPDPAEWNQRQRNLAWRLRSSAARNDLADCILVQKPDLATFRRLVYTFGLCYTDEERQQNRDIFKRFQSHEAFQGTEYQQTISEFLEKDISDPDPELLTQSYLFPAQLGAMTELGTIEEIATLKPNLDNGRAKAALCLMCHPIGSGGVPFGPNLTNWGQVRDLPSVIQALVDPSAELAHGYDKPVVVTQKGHRLEGVSRGYSWHAGAIRVKTMGGVTLKVPFRKPKAEIEYLENHSWMPSAAAMGLSDQDVRDIAEYLMGDIAGEVDSGLTVEFEPEFSRGEGPGWVELTGEDFHNVSCFPDTWRWEGSHAWCTGKPTGVIRYTEPLTNFEFSCEWMHRKHGGNSGVFLWASPESLNAVMERGRGLPKGIEVQVLDLGYREVYEKQFNKPGDWFTSHGDVFAVGPGVKMNPFPPVGPRGSRSFPSKETTKGINEWNHYYIRAIDGVVRLWVNGEEVSGGEGISPAKGYLCLESEGAPVEFRNLRLRVLPPFETKMEVALEERPEAEEERAAKRAKPGRMKSVGFERGHPLLGTWAYRETYTREFTEDGRCILRNGDEVIWEKPVTEVTSKSAMVEGRYAHLLDGDVLRIEGNYEAKRTRQNLRADKEEQKLPPNVIYLFTDDQRFNTIGALGNSDIITPNLDRLAERSFVFHNAYCFGGNVPAVCIPARNMNMTGNTFFQFNEGKEDWRRQPRDKGKGHTFPKSMKAAGYETFNREKSGIANLPHIRTQFDYYGDIDMIEQLKSGYAARTTINDSIDYLENTRDNSKPFFMYLGLPCPHDPRLSAPEFQEMYDKEAIPLPENYLPVHPWDIGESTMTARDERLEDWPRTKEAIKGHLFDYYSLITSMDADIGRLLDALDEMGLRDNTIIVFSSDQGLAIGSHGLMGKQSLYDDVMKVPMFFSGPGIPKGESDALMYLHDVYPTVCDLVGAEVPRDIDGVSFAPVIEGEKEKIRDHLMFAYSTTQRAIRDERWKLIRYPEINRTQLFDLETDPWETKNLATDPAQEDRIERLMAQLRQEQKARGDDQPLSTENPKDADFDPPTEKEIRDQLRAKREAKAARAQ